MTDVHPPLPRDYEGSLHALNSTQLHGDSLRRAYSARRATMEAMRTYLHRLGMYEKIATTLPTLHITGSKGKGSTCAFIESILHRQGVKTVLFTSPHLVRVNERIRLNGQPLSKDKWTQHFWAVWDQLQATAPPPASPTSAASNMNEETSVVDPSHINNTEPEAIPGYFRFLTLLCLWVALEEGADVLILEVGVGGRFDATNVVPCPTACCITTLDLEHTDLLGSRIEDIAWEKGGIIKPHVPCFVSPQPPQHALKALRVLRECAQEVEAPLCIVKPLPSDLKLGIVGDFQSMNAALALAAAQQYWYHKARKENESEVKVKNAPMTKLVMQEERKHEEIEIETEQIPLVKVTLQEATEKEGLEGCTWPGRCQRLDRTNKKEKCIFYIDGAHTQESMRIATKWFDDETQSQPQPQSQTQTQAQTPMQQSSPPRALIFNCGEEKTVPDLLSHLILTPQGTSRFDLVLFCPMASAKPTLAHARPARVLLLEEGEEGAYASQLGDQERLRGLCEALEKEKGEEKEKEESGKSSSSTSLPWQNAPRDTWRVLQAYHYTQTLTGAHTERESSPSSSFFAQDLQGVDQVTRTMVKPSVEAAMEEIQMFAARAGAEALGKGRKEKGGGEGGTKKTLPALQVLVTGSLYLVGNVLGDLEQE